MGVTPGRPQRQREAPGTPAGRDPVRHGEAFVTGGAYGVLVLLGLIEAVIGSFQYGWMAGPVPAAALGCCAAILATCLLAGWGMRSFGGALAPALGWVAGSFVLAMPGAMGSVIITNTTAGRWYLYGGAISAAAGVVIAFAAWVRSHPAQ
jgi:hypothetical protein